MGAARHKPLVPLVLVLLLGAGFPTGSRPGEAQAPARPAASPAEGAEPRLIGVVIAQDGRGRAYLQDARTGRVRAYEVGETVGDARVVAIEPNRVVLDRDGSRLDIRFGRASGGEGVPAAPGTEPAAHPPAEAGPSPDPAASPTPAPVPGQPGAPPADAQPCPPNCPVPAVPSGPGPRPSP